MGAFPLKMAQTADRRKAEQDAQRRISKLKREMREEGPGIPGPHFTGSIPAAYVVPPA